LAPKPFPDEKTGNQKSEVRLATASPSAGGHGESALGGSDV